MADVTLTDLQRKLPSLAKHVWPALSGCWVWTGYRNPGGYGQAHDGMAHRLVYEATVAPIPHGLQIDHLCNNPPCVNPAHLEPVTGEENLRRAFEPSRGVAPHPYVAKHNASGYRRGCRCDDCRDAHRDRVRQQKADRRERLRADPSLAPHGSASTYTNWGCRCDDCRAANTSKRISQFA